MTAAQTAELEALEAWAAAGGPSTYTHNGRTVSRDPKTAYARLDQLRATQARESSSGTCPVAKFRGQD